MTLNASRNVGQREETMSHLAEATSSHTLDCFSSGNIVFEFDCEIIASLPYRRAQASITQFKHNAAAELPLIDCTASTAQLVNYDKTIQRFQPKEADEAAPPEAEEGIFGSAMYAMGYFDKFFVKTRQLGRCGPRVTLLVRHVLDSIELGSFACRRIPVGGDHAW